MTRNGVEKARSLHADSTSCSSRHDDSRGRSPEDSILGLSSHGKRSKGLGREAFPTHARVALAWSNFVCCPTATGPASPSPAVAVAARYGVSSAEKREKGDGADLSLFPAASDAGDAFLYYGAALVLIVLPRPTPTHDPK